MDGGGVSDGGNGGIGDSGGGGGGVGNCDGGGVVGFGLNFSGERGMKNLYFRGLEVVLGMGLRVIFL